MLPAAVGEGIRQRGDDVRLHVGAQIVAPSEPGPFVSASQN